MIIDLLYYEIYLDCMLCVTMDFYIIDGLNDTVSAAKMLLDNGFFFYYIQKGELSK